MKHLFLSLAAAAGFLFVGCEDDDNTALPAPQTIADIVIANDDFSSLEAALIKADLVNVFQGTDEYTVFAPTNAAFAEFLQDNGFNSLDEVPAETVKVILQNHVLVGEKVSGDLANGYEDTLNNFGTTSSKIDMYINTDSGVTINGAADVTSANVQAINGVVHVVNKVIPMPTVVTFAVADPTFDNLQAALTAEGLPTNFVEVLSSVDAPAPFTVFAPTNGAFADLLTELEFDSLGDLVAGIGTAALDEVLKYHVVAEANVLSTDLSNGAVSMLSGEDLTVDLAGPTVTDVADRMANIIVTDVQASNGVIHALDKVVLPTLDD